MNAKNKSKSSKPDSLLCWCGNPDSQNMVGCHACPGYEHYGFTGIELASKLNSLLHEDPAVYLCKKCAPGLSPNDKKFEADGKSGTVYLPAWFGFGSQENRGNPGNIGNVVLSDVQFQQLLGHSTKAAVKAATETAKELVQEMLEKQLKEKTT